VDGQDSEDHEKTPEAVPECVARLPDKTRVDCLIATHAVEYDFGSEGAEAIRQVFYYFPIAFGYTAFEHIPTIVE
jgi:hypothetical protein